MILNCFEKSLEEISKIPDIEPKILSSLYKALKNETYIKTPMKPREKPVENNRIPDENAWIWELLEELRSKLERGCQPLNEYLK